MSDRATLSTVAARAGVSPSTASLASPDSPRVAPATRRAGAAGRQTSSGTPDPTRSPPRRAPAAAAWSAPSSASGCSTRFRDPVAVQLLDGLTEELGTLGVGLLLLAGDSMRSGPTPAQLAPAGRWTRRCSPTCGLEDDPAFRLLQARQVPLVAVEGPVVPGVPLVGIEDRDGTAGLARHLAELGHRDAAMVVMPSGGRRRGRSTTAAGGPGVDRGTGSGCSG